MSERVELALLPDERWWGGAVADGTAMPFGRPEKARHARPSGQAGTSEQTGPSEQAGSSRPVATRAALHRRNLATSAGLLDDDSAGSNQSAPLLVSSRGRYVWSDQPFTFAFSGTRLTLEGSGLVVEAPGTTVAEAFRAASAAHFPASGKGPARQMFTGPQYNTWIEMPYRPTQEQVLRYVGDLLDAGFPPGVVMIDDSWAPAYGTWRFRRDHFPDPSAMVARLHDWGCPVMLWLVPFVSPDTATFRLLEERGLLLKDAGGATAIRRWWNGLSAVLDATNDDAVAWLRGVLDRLVDEHGIDGFKFDAGDLRDYRFGDRTARPADPTGHCEAWARVGLAYPYNEYRACWKMGGQPLAQRLHDKPPTWDALASLIPEGIAQGLLGHPFGCPDMIGGGDVAAFQDGRIDQELFVRSAQCAALFPMMQFSLSPHRVLDPQHLAAVTSVVALRQSLLPEILALVERAATTGEPMLRTLAYHHAGYEDIHDEFLLGADLLVAPVLLPGARTRAVVLPPGQWKAWDGGLHSGPATIDVRVTIEDLPWFRRS